MPGDDGFFRSKLLLGTAICLRGADMFFPAELAGPLMMRDTITGLRPASGKVEFSWALPEGPSWGCGPYDASVAEQDRSQPVRIG